MKVANLDDPELMRQVSAGSVVAFGQLYDRFCHRAYGVAYSVCRDEGRAQDAVQEAFLSLWRSRTSYRPQRGTVAGWLLTVVRYRAIDLVRRHSSDGARWAGDTQLEERPAPGDVAESLIERDRADHLRGLLARLPEEQQEVITLAYFGQMTHTEIATALRLPPGTVKGRMRLGLQKLRASMNHSAA